MFILTTIADLVELLPHEQGAVYIRQAIEDRIHEKYANKVVQKVGLCLSVYDIPQAESGVIGYGTGNTNVNVEFRMVVFRPFKGEIVTGQVYKCTPEGIMITMHFFEDIFVPKTMLFEGCEFDDAEQTWVWRTEDSELWFDEGTIVNFRVEAETWTDQAPKAPGTGSNATEKTRSVPYAIEASMAEAGLGGVEWW